MSEAGEWEHNTAEEILPDGEHAAVLTASADVTILVDETGTIQAHADQDDPTLGYPPDTLAGEPVRALFASNARPSPLFDVDSPDRFAKALLADDGETVTAPVRAADEHLVALSLRTVRHPETEALVCLGHDLTAQLSRVREHRTEDELFRAVADPMYVLDADGCFERVNDALVECMGYSRDELLGRSIAGLVPANEYKRVTSRLLELVDTEKDTERFKSTFITRDGERVLAETNVTALTDESGSFAGSVGVIHDIRDRIKRERDLTLLKEVLTRVFRHNVRNELMVVTGHAELLEREVGEEVQEHTEQICATAERLLAHGEKARLIERVIETNERTTFDITDDIERIVERARGEHPDASIDAELPESAVVDAHPEMPNAVEELVDNAVEHAPEQEPPSVEVWIEQRDGVQTLFVEDESGGLSDHEVTVLEEGNETELEHSSGVGLWLIRWLVECSGGEMIVHRTDEGSLMGIRFETEQATGAGTGLDQSPLANTPAYLRDASPRRFQGDTVVGRVEALDRLEEIYQSLERTGGHSVLVTGEAGVGKTTLLEQFREQLTGAKTDALVATGGCESAERPSYHAFRQILDGLPGDRDGADILAETTGLSEGDTDEDEQHRQDLFAEVADEIRAIATTQPVVVLVEDMQWADRATISLFESLVDEVGQWGYPVLFLGTYRTGEVDPEDPVSVVAEKTAASSRGTVIELDPLDQDEVRSLLAHTFGVEEVPPSFVESVYDHTGGTPLFVGELARHLVDSLGPIRTGADLPERLDDVTVPETVESAVKERVAALGPKVLPVLRLGAVLGREFSLDLLREASRLSMGALVEHIETLVRREVWERSETGIEFSHGVVREQTLETIPADRRRALHASAARAIEAIYRDDRREYASLLGYHYEQVGAYETAFSYYRQAGTYEAETYANEEAITHYQQALSIAHEHDVVGEIARASVSTDLGEVYKRRGEYDKTVEAFRQSLSWYRACGNEAGEAESLYNLGDVAEDRSQYDLAREYYEDSLRLFEEIGNSEGAAKNLNALGIIAKNRGAYDHAKEYYERSLDIRREIGDREGQADSLNNLGIVAKSRGAHDRARECYERSLEIRRETGDRAGEAAGYNNLGVYLRDRGEYDQSRKQFERGLELFREIGGRKGEAVCLNNLGHNAVTRGAYDKAREYFEQSLGIRREIGDREGEALSLKNLGIVAREYDESERARKDFTESLALAREVDAIEPKLETLRGLGAVARDQGAYQQSAAYFEEALGTCSADEHCHERATIHLERSRLALARGDIETARDAVETAACTFDELDATHKQARVRHQQGRIAAETGADEAAREHWASALETFRTVGAVPDALRTLRCLVTATEGDERAATYRDTARELFEGAPEPVRDRHGDWLGD